jgi:nitrogen fixation NifU-like protein
LAVEDGVIKDIGFDGHGCAISTASASLMTDALKGKTVEEAEQLFNNMHKLLTSKQAPVNAPEVGKLKVLQGVRAYPARIKCATLAWHTLQAALQRRNDAVTTE